MHSMQHYVCISEIAQIVTDWNYFEVPCEVEELERATFYYSEVTLDMPGELGKSVQTHTFVDTSHIYV